MANGLILVVSNLFFGLEYFIKWLKKYKKLLQNLFFKINASNISCIDFTKYSVSLYFVYERKFKLIDKFKLYRKTVFNSCFLFVVTLCLCVYACMFLSRMICTIVFACACDSSVGLHCTMQSMMWLPCVVVRWALLSSLSSPTQRSTHDHVHLPALIDAINFDGE